MTARRTFTSDVTLISAFAHMHLRGKDMHLWANLPGGGREDLLVIGNYNFDWQRKYHFEPGEVKLPAGTTVEVVGRFDNSSFNPYNPDPDQTVEFGPSTYDEMMYCWVHYTKDGEEGSIVVDPETGAMIDDASR